MGNPNKMFCCKITTGAVLMGTLQAVIVTLMMAGSALILARYRYWKNLQYHPYYTTTVPTTSTQVALWASCLRKTDHPHSECALDVLLSLLSLGDAGLDDGCDGHDRRRLLRSQLEMRRQYCDAVHAALRHRSNVPAQLDLVEVSLHIVQITSRATRTATARGTSTRNSRAP